MFDALFGRKFSAKCKQSIKSIKARVYERRKKKQALLNFLKKDIADLLAIDHEANAFARMDGLIVEMSHVSCYDMIEKFCDCIMNDLPILQKSRECPQENMEAMATLIFAAARFSDLPELSNLRRVFTNRYGGSMESSVNPEFVENISKKSFGRDRKLKLMQEIAYEFSVEWDSKDFGKKKSTPPVTDQPKKGDPIHDGKKEGVFDDILRQELPPLTKDIHVIAKRSNGIRVDSAKKIGFFDEPKHIKPYKTDATIHTPIQPRIISKVLVTEDNHDTDTSIHRQGSAREQTYCITRERQAEGELKIGGNKVSILAPPYVKPQRYTNRTRGESDRDSNVTYAIQKQVAGPLKSVGGKSTTIFPPHITQHTTKDEFPTKEHIDKTKERHDRDCKGLDPSMSIANPAINRIPPYFRRNVSKNEVQIEHIENDSAEYDKPIVGEKDLQLEDLHGNMKPKPRSIRRKYPKPPSVHDVAIDGDELVDRIISGRKQGNQINERGLKNGCDEEEEVIERLLMHYSKKKVGEQFDKPRTISNPPINHVVEIVEVGNRQNDVGKNPPHVMEQECAPSKSVSVPRESNVPGDFKMQTDALSPQGGRVHPRLPDYDELAARFNALKRSSL